MKDEGLQKITNYSAVAIIVRLFCILTGLQRICFFSKELIKFTTNTKEC